MKEKMKEKKLKLKENVGKISKKHLKNGSYTMGISAVFIAAVVLVNLIVGELPSKYSQIDISDSGLYSIGKETEEMLHNLESDVTIYQIAQDGSEDENIKSLLKRYEDESKHIEVKQKDPVVNPGFISEYTEDNLSNNSLIVESGERSKVINYNDMYESSIDYNTYSYQTTGFDGEGQITSAIGYVTSEELPVLYTLEGHGEVSMDSTLKDSIEKANMEIQTLNLLTEGDVPEDADCVMINAPTSDISAEEKDALLSYLENGGKAMIFTDYTGTEMKNLEAVLENYGVQTAEGIVFEGDSQHYAMQMPYYLIPTVNSTDATYDVASGERLILMPYAQGIQKLDEVRDTVTIESLLTTTDKAYSKTNMNSTQIEKEEGDIAGPLDLGVSITEKLDEEKETKIVYYSASALLDGQVNQMVSGGNHELLLSSLKWMTGAEENASVAIPAKSLEMSYLTLTDYDASFWKICTIGLIPGFFLVVGFGIWLKRRKA